MKNIQSLSWFVFIIAIAMMLVQRLYVSSHSQGFKMVCLELADTKQGAALLSEWHDTKVDTASLLDYARSNTLMDFLFIIGYTGVLLAISYNLMQREKTRWINEALRACLLLAFLAGLLDIVENGILLFDMYRYQPGNIFYPSLYVSYPKWLFVVVIPIVWVISLGNRAFFHER